MIRKQSDKGRRTALIYSERRKWFLAQPENQICPVAMDIFDEKRGTSQIHHVRGRGKFMLDESTWLAVSFDGHNWLHAHPSEAKARGWMLSREG